MPSPDGRQLYVWRGEDLFDDLNALVDAIAESAADLFDWDGALVFPQAGIPTPVTRDTLLELLDRHVAVKKLVNHGTADRPSWECTYSNPMDVCPWPANKVIQALISGKTLEGRELAKGGLLGRVPKA